MKQRLLAALLSLTMGLSLMPAPAAAETFANDVPEEIAVEENLAVEAEELDAAGMNYDGEVGTLPWSTTVNITEAGTRKIYKLTTPVNGSYVFNTTGSSDTYGYLYDADGNQITYNDDGGENYNFEISYTLTAGTVVYVGTKFYSSSSTGSFTLQVSVEGTSGGSTDIDYDGEVGTLPWSTEILGAEEKYKFTAPANGGYYFSVYCTTACVALYNEYGEQILSGDEEGYNYIRLEAGTVVDIVVRSQQGHSGYLEVLGFEDITVFPTTCTIPELYSRTIIPSQTGRYRIVANGVIHCTAYDDSENVKRCESRSGITVELKAGHMYDLWTEFDDCVATISKAEDVAPVVRVASTSGGNRYTTAVATADQIKKEVGISKFETIVVANAENYPDALSGGPLASGLNAPILLVGQNTSITMNYIKSNLKSGGKVYLLGGTMAVSSTVENQLKTSGYNVERLAGADRYGTNIAIANKMLDLDMEAHDWWYYGCLAVVQGTGYADSLSISGAAGYYGFPVLMVPKDGLSADAIAFLRRAYSCGYHSIYIIGGTYAVTEKTESKLEEVHRNMNVSRISGANRFETSIEIAERFSMYEMNNTVLAYAMNFPDGLTGGVLAGIVGAPVLLVTDTGYKAAESYLNAGTSSYHLYAMGGKLVISDATVTKLKAAMDRGWYDSSDDDG